MDFIGREKEMSLLNEEFSKDHSLIIIKGRRRVGKADSSKSSSRIRSISIAR